MRIFLWHGYLLSGTGSNEYTAALARTLQRQGHDVTVFCQDPDAASLDLGGAHVIRPALPGPLPVFVLDRYADAEPVRLPDMSVADRDAFVAANAEAIRDAGPADLLVANHVLLGAPVAAASGLPFVVKAHGSELEYSMRGNDELCRWARDSLTGALAVIAGSQHIERVVMDLVDVDPRLIHVIPPGVDTDVMRPEASPEALAALLAECAADPPNEGNERLPDPGNAQRLEAFFADLSGPAAVYVGKISDEKGVPLLVEAVNRLELPTVIVGFGPARPGLEAVAGPHVIFTGPLQHRHLRHLWPLMSASVAPSVFPEAFGMVAAEAASCGCPPLVADHTGLAEIAAGLRTTYPARFADLTSFPSGDVDALTDRLDRLTSLTPADRAEVGEAARRAVIDLWSWDSVAQRITDLVD
ncbi:MAG: glycosyltransferase family 4 protein [Candidatus Nanopelagicales bacterium]